MSLRDYLYYEDDQATIYCGDATEVMRLIAAKGVDLVLTDPPYGLNGGAGGGNGKRAKSKYETDKWEDSPEYIYGTCAPLIRKAVRKYHRVIVTPGCRNLHMYPAADDMGCFWAPAAMGHGAWGFATFNPILYYGHDPRAGKGQSPNGTQVVEAAEVEGHPCPKPLNAWKWLLAKGSMEGETVLDPFMGSGTTLRAAKDLGRKAIGIEIEEKYCAIAVDRLAQTVMQL